MENNAPIENDAGSSRGMVRIQRSHSKGIKNEHRRNSNAGDTTPTTGRYKRYNEIEICNKKAEIHK